MAKSKDVLNDRELAVLKLVKEGNRTRAIASMIFMSEATVKRHIRDIIEKLDADTLPQAVAKAYQLRIFRV